MHLLLAQKGLINEGEEAVDLGQTRGEIVFLSAADTELSSLAEAVGQLKTKAPDLRLANIMQLSHPMSVDVYAANIIAKAKLVVVRLLGGRRYWEYGVETLAATAEANGIPLAFLPGDDKPDPDLSGASTLAGEHLETLWSYLLEGGPQNSENFLRYCGWLIDRSDEPPAPVPLLKAGLWWPGEGITGLDRIRTHWKTDQPVAAITFYRALVQSGGLEPIEAMAEALAERGLNALPLFV